MSETASAPRTFRDRLRIAIAALALVTAIMAPIAANAQVLGLHFIHVPAKDGRRASLGVQGEAGIIAPTSRVDVWASLALEYQRQDSLGPGRGRLAAELRFLAPRHDRSVDPYLGASLSANRSGGTQSEWNGTLQGLEGMVGLLMTPNDRLPLALLLEERFGYVREQNHFTATHLGVVFRFY